MAHTATNTAKQPPALISALTRLPYDPPYEDLYTPLADLSLDVGHTLKQPRLAWRRFGRSDRPVVLVLGGISSSRRVWEPRSAPTSGWWQNLLGPAQTLDTQRYQFLSLDFLGGNGDSTGPHHLDPASQQRGADFPAISTRDQARAMALGLKELGLTRLHSVIGASYGGMVALALAEHFPQLLRRALVICAADAPWPLASGWRHVQREVVRLGLRHNDVEPALKLARALAMTTYRSGQEFAQRFAAEGHCADYLEHCGLSFARRFDPHAFLCLSASIDSHFCQPNQIKVPIDLLGFASDQLVPVSQLQTLHAQLPDPGWLSLCESLYGHDAFLKEDALMKHHITRHFAALEE